MGKHAAPLAEQVYVTRDTARNMIVQVLCSFRRDRPDEADAAIDLAIDLVTAAGMAPPDLDSMEQATFAFNHDDNAVLGMELLATLSPEFAEHLRGQLDVAYGTP